MLPLSQGRKGRLCLFQLLRRLGSFSACLEYLSSFAGVSTNHSEGPEALFASQLKQAQARQVLDRRVDYCQNTINALSLVVLTCFDSAYPESLKAIPDPPLALFIKMARAKLCQEHHYLSKGRVAIVGSRRALINSRNFAEQLSRGLADHHFEIVSGLALGVDAAAHKGALQSINVDAGRCTTLAVLGSGHQSMYPRANQALYRQIINSGGLILSEYLPHVPPLKQNFPARNRIVSGLSACVIVIEAGIKSGSLITARVALEQGRDVLASPGMVGDPRFGGCHRLIKQGAGLIDSIDDVFDALGLPALRDEDRVKPDLSDMESRIIGCIAFKATALDCIIGTAGCPVPRLMVALLRLEMLGLVQRCQGGYVRLA